MPYGTATFANPAADANPTSGIKGIRCPACAAEDTLAIDVDSGSVRCLEDACEETFTPDELRATANGLLRLVRWIEACPAD